MDSASRLTNCENWVVSMTRTDWKSRSAIIPRNSYMLRKVRPLFSTYNVPRGSKCLFAPLAIRRYVLFRISQAWRNQMVRRHVQVEDWAAHRPRFLLNAEHQESTSYHPKHHPIVKAGSVINTTACLWESHCSVVVKLVASGPRRRLDQVFCLCRQAQILHRTCSRLSTQRHNGKHLGAMFVSRGTRFDWLSKYIGALLIRIRSILLWVTTHHRVLLNDL